ncbi:hypothetical protein [Prosthecobacter sp.]|uniref:hypothetical protein n=1 Tax=Prosthecobacter sp. TaxID=1965333 RepID=UPI003783FACB
MTSSPDVSSTASRWVLLVLGVLAAALALLAAWKGEDAWAAAGWMVAASGLGLVVLVCIWHGGLKAGRPLRALRDSIALGVAMVLAAVSGQLRRDIDLSPTKARVERLAAAIAEYQRGHDGALPESLEGIESALPTTTFKTYPISYKRQPDGTFSLYFQPAWYRHEYFPAKRSWTMVD